MEMPRLTTQQIEQIAKIMADTDKGFTGTEIGHHLAQCRMNDPDPGMTKWKRLYNAFCEAVNSSGGSTNSVLAFVKHCFEPAQGLDNPERYVWMMSETNKVLMLVGIEICDDGQFHRVFKAQGLSEVKRRTEKLWEKLMKSNAHNRVLLCCTDELLTEDYFHAVHEAAKSLCDHVREMTNLSSDGSELFNTAFSNKDPYLLFGNVTKESGKNMQNGLKESLNGVIHMIRNVTAHELRIHWDVNERDAVDVLLQISYLHRLIDKCDIVKTA